MSGWFCYIAKFDMVINSEESPTPKLREHMIMPPNISEAIMLL
ncbi:MAG: hypothetical protein ABFD79_17505 [Phycisphaerales bacterium]